MSRKVVAAVHPATKGARYVKDSSLLFIGRYSIKMHPNQCPF